MKRNDEKKSLVQRFCSSSYLNKNDFKNNNKLDCNYEYKLSEVNNKHSKPFGNNINKDILTQVQIAQNSMNNELHDIKKIFIPFPNKTRNKNNELKSQISNDNEDNKKINNIKNNSNKKNNYKNYNYRDIPLTKFFQ